MPEFHLNVGSALRCWFNSRDSFTQGYIEAMFFTNCDTGDDDEFIANRLGVSRLTKDLRNKIVEDCAVFQRNNHGLLNGAYERDYDASQAGADFWFTRQGHGTGFWDRQVLEADELGDRLKAAAEIYGEVNAYVKSGWIYIS